MEIHTGTPFQAWSNIMMQPPKKDFEFILNCAAHVSDVQQVRNTRTCLLYGTETYIPTTKPDLIDQFDRLSISK